MGAVHVVLIGAVALVAVAVLGVAPAVAHADTRWRGWAAPGRSSAVWVRDDYTVSRARIDWKARCRRPGYRFVGSTRFDEPRNGARYPMQNATEGAFAHRFADSGAYRVRVSRRIVAFVLIRLRGGLGHDPGNAHADFASGRVTGRVRVERRGKTIDRCRIKTRFESYVGR